MPSHEVNVNLIEKQQLAGRAARVSSATDDAALVKLARLLKDYLEDNTRKTGAAIDKMAHDFIREVVRGSHGASGGINDTQIKSLLKGLGNEVAREITRSISKSIPTGTQQRPLDDNILLKKLDNSINSATDKMARSISDKLSKQLGVNIDASKISKGLGDVVRQALPKNTGMATRDLLNAVNSLKMISRDIGVLVNGIKGMRASGGKVDVTEIGSVVSYFKKMATDVRDLGSEAKKAKESFAALAKEAPETLKEFNQLLGQIKRNATMTSKGVAERAINDPRAFSKDIISSFLTIIKSSDVLKGTKLEAAATKLEKASENIDKFSTEFKNFKRTFKGEVSSGKISLEGADKLIKDFDRTLKSFGNIPKSLGFEGVPEQMREVLQGLEKFSKKASTITTEVKMIVDDSELKKIASKPIEIEAVISPDVKTLYSDVKSTLDSVIKSFGRTPIKKEVQPIVKELVELEAKVETGNVADIVRQFQKVLQKKSFEFEISASDDALKLLDELKYKIRSLESQAMIDLGFNYDSASVRGGVKDLDTLKKKTKELAEESKAARVEMEKVSRVTSMTQTNPRLEAVKLHGRAAKQDPFKDLGLFRKGLLEPGAESYQPSQIPRTISSEASKIKEDTDRRIKSLAASLEKLQLEVISNLEKHFEELAKKGKKWEIVRPGGVQDNRRLFQTTGGGRQWAIQIANVDKLRSVVKDMDGTADQLIAAYRSRKTEEIAREVKLPEQMANQVGKWLKNITEEQLRATKGLQPTSVAKLVRVQRAYKDEKEVGSEMSNAIKDAFGEIDLREVFKTTAAMEIVNRRMQQSGIVRNVALPAAHITEQGSATFRTIHGSERAIPKFAQYQTGFERLQQGLFDIASQQRQSGQKPTVDYNAFVKRVKDIPARPQGEKLLEAENLSADLLKEIIKAPEPEKRFESIKKYFSEAAIIKSAKRAEQGFGEQADITEKVNSAIKTFEKIPANDQTINDFLNAMKQAGVSAYDAVKTLDRIKQFNVYDILGEVLKAQGGPLENLGKNPIYDRSIRDFETAISEVEGLLPLLESNRPRRGYHQENVVNLLTRRSDIFSASREDQLTPDEQKNYVKDLNVRLNDLIKESKLIRREVPLELEHLQSLGLPESMAGNVQDLRPGSRTGTRFLNQLNATQFKLYSEDIPSLAPFKQFQQAGRNISGVTNAMVDLNQEFAESPLLRSQKEKALIESSRYGTGKYGFNVTAELRNTAANFEDQIVIAGKLAQAFTEANKILIKPGPRGRIRGSEQEKGISTGVTRIEEKEFTANVDKALRQYMEILGVPEKYEGRADKALIKKLEDTIAVVRGEDVEVQQAKLTETFLNYFGRKFTTRYGSKGVSITPTGQQQDLPELLEQFAGKKIKIDPSATLGFAKTPKPVGELVSDLFGKDISDELKSELIASGNKFIIDLFQKVGDEAIVTEEEAVKTQELYTKFTEAWQKVFSSPVPTPDVKGIEQIRSLYSEKFGQKELFNIKPIDVRISSYGAAKRGLQTEFMESIFGNVAGVGKGGVTTVPELKQPAYQKLLGAPGQAGALAEYSKALGFVGTTKSIREIMSDPKVFGTDKLEKAEKILKEKGREGLKGDEADTIKKYDEAMKAAILESTSSFYTDIIDELGKSRKSLVGPKFLQIVEEPHLNPEWQRGQIERGAKGARLNLPAFSAYATVFGEQSEIIKEVQQSLDVNAKKHWEYLKALQTINEQDTDVYDELTRNLRTVDIGALQKFTASTGVYGAENEFPEGPGGPRNERSFANTILDVDKYPDPFKLKIPTGKRTPEGAAATEDIYVPGALARGTYPEPLIAGEYGLDQMSRRLVHLTNMAKELNDLLTDPEKFLNETADYSIADSIKGAVGTMVQQANKLRKSQGPEVTAELQKMIQTLQPVLSSSAIIDPKLIKGDVYQGMTETQFFESQLESQRAKVVEGKKTSQEAMAYLISTLSDLIIGKSPESGEFDPTASTVLSRAKFGGEIGGLAGKLGIDVVQDTINKKVESLQKAKIEYYNSLAETALGKEGSINELLFSRKIPAVMGKAVVAVTDKRKDIDAFEKSLRSIEDKYAGSNIEAAKGLTSLAGDTREVWTSHVNALKRYKEAGIPVLSQEELGVPEKFAEKIPLEFRRARIQRGQLEVDKESKKGTLLDLLREAQKYEGIAFKEGNTELGNQIREYIDKELVAYIESIRFPFTGVSSLAPYKPKLIGGGVYKDKEGRALESNALIVPGMPEGLEGLETIIGNVSKRIESLVSRREELQAAGGPQEEIENLTNLIRDLSSAVSNVIPKYTAQAQKLDFDGDQIEIHAAKTAAARKDIQEHFKQFHVRSPKDASTSEIFRDMFLGDAIQKSTGEFVMAESRQAFGKKFPGQSFDFMKSPFLTKEMEYLDPVTALEALKERSGDIGNLSNVIEKVLVERMEDKDKVVEIMERLAEVDQNDARALIDTIKAMNDDTLYKVVERGIKGRLYEEKFRDTIEAQLFKIHTGPETEGLYRVHRIAESNIGFGERGQLGGAKGFRASDYFKQRFPSNLKSLGDNAAEEFHTAMNEILRFGIQKGMDVKHAGQKPLAGEMVKYLSKDIGGAQELYTKILEEDSYKELKDFDAANRKAIEMRLGALSTPDLAAEARSILTARGEDVGQIDKMSTSPDFREMLKELIVEKIGLKGFLEELALLIKKEAIEGLIKQAEEWTPAKKQKPGFGLEPVKGDIAEWAKRQIERQIGDTGINIAQSVTQSKQSLYPFRTYGASTSAELNKFRSKYGDIAVPEESLSGIPGRQREEYMDKYKRALATSRNVKEQLQAFDFDKQGGAYSDMVRTAIDAMYADQAKIESVLTQLNKEGYDPASARKLDLVTRVTSGEGVSGFASKILAAGKEMRNLVEEYSEIAGIPELNKQDMFTIEETTGAAFRDYIENIKKIQGKDINSGEIRDEVNEFVNNSIEKAQALMQLDRVLEAMQARSSEGRVLQKLLPKSKLSERIDTNIPSQADAIAEARKAMAARKPAEQRDLNLAFTVASEEGIGGPGVPGGGFPVSTGPGGSPIPVYIVGAADNVTLNVRGLRGASLMSPESPVAQMQQQAELQKDMEAKHEELKNIIQKTRSAGGEEVSLSEFFSPSRLSAGGKHRGRGAYRSFTEAERVEEQIQRIADKLQGKDEMDDVGEALTSWGTAIHAKLEKFLEEHKNVKSEVYGEIETGLAGTIGGTADIIEYTTDEQQKIAKVADIKTVSADKIEKIKKAISQAGTDDLSKIVEKAPADVRRTLEEYYSQLNAYLKIFDESALGEIRFYDREKFGEDLEDYTAVKFPFSEERFQGDVKALAEARKRVAEGGGTFGTIIRGRQEAPTGASLEELDQAMRIAKERYEALRKGGARPSVLQREGDEDVRSQAARAAENVEKFARAKSTAQSYVQAERYIVPPEIRTGVSTEDLFENLKTLHDQAAIYQQMKGVDASAISQFPDRIKELLGPVSTKGPDYEAFIEATKRLKDLGQLSDMNFIKAWKAYRIEVGNWLVNQAIKAQNDVKEMERSGDLRGANKAYGQFQASTKRLQEFVRRGIGKKTDIYTEDKRFVYPMLAEAAGVYMSPDQIMKKVGEPLGDDEQLISTYKNITGNLSKLELTPPSGIARDTFREITNMNKELVGLIARSEEFQKAGIDVAAAWDFDKLATRSTRLREALQQLLKQSGELDAVQKKNIDGVVKYLKHLEGLYTHSNLGSTEEGQIGIIPVPKFESPATQKALHERNVRQIREYFSRSQEEGGAEVGQSFNYTEKIIGSAGEVLKNVVHTFHKYGESLNTAGQATGQFSEGQKDLVERMQKTNATFGNAVRRVVMWGAASKLIYGGVAQLKSSLDELANIELGIAELRMVLNPLETDFARLTKATTGFAKQYGVPVTDVLKSMKIFAQQGLKQSDIIDRTQTATLASNVTTLNAKEATEALTAAMVIFKEEGNKSLRFLDAWSEVEAKHAITAGDMANAIKKSAAAAKVAGVTFDELNGIVAAIGSTTRQTGNEVGTSMRFILRRLFSEGGPKALAQLQIPTMTGAGENRRGFEVLSDLADRWKDLTQAQKLNIAQALGGTRQYNSLIVLMDQWDEALRGIRNSTNSKGSAERRNLEIMKTYAKQLEQTKAAATELKMEFGKIVLPAFKVGLTGLRTLFEVLTAIPGPIKAATAAFAALFTFGAKGFSMFDGLSEAFGEGSTLVGNFVSEFMKQWELAKYEITGQGLKGEDVLGLKVITPAAKKLSEAAGNTTNFGDSLVQQGSKLSDFQSSFGKMAFLAVNAGRSFNEMLGELAVSSGYATERIGETTSGIGKFLSHSALGIAAGKKLSPKNLVGAFQGEAAVRGLGGAAVRETLSKEGLKGLGTIAKKAAPFITEIAGVSATAVGGALDYLGESIGGAGQKIIKDFSTQQAGFIKSLAPLAVTVATLYPALKSAAGYFKEMSGNAKEFEASMDSLRQTNDENLRAVRGLSQEYSALESKLSDVSKAQQPGSKERRQTLETYEAPLTTLRGMQQRVIDLNNQMADSNLGLVVGYDRLGNAVLKTSVNFKSYLKEVERINAKTGIKTELDIVGRYAEDLTKGTKSDKIRKAVKDLAEAFPVVGDLISRNIDLSPTAAIETAVEDINKRLALKQKYPISTAVDADIKRLQDVLGKARGTFNEAAADLQRVYSGILAPSTLKGLSRSDIEEVLKSEELQRAREVLIEIDPKFKLINAVPAAESVRTEIDKIIRDMAKENAVSTLLGRDVLSALNPEVGGLLDFNSQLTKANLESAGVIERQGKAFSGDIITFFDNAAEKYNIAGNQAIVKIDDTNRFVVEYFNTKTLEIEQKPLSEVEAMVDAIFPLQKIQEDLAYRMDALNTFVAGAAAGLTGISDKDFKKEFNLGARFFSEVPTTTLLQGSRGFTPRLGFGEIPGMTEWRKQLEEFYLEPMEELRSKIESAEKLRLEGLETGDVNLSREFYNEVNNLLTILKNNQVVVQFRAVWADLMKEMSNSVRILKEDVAVQKERNKVNVVSSGLTRGLAKDLTSIDLGVYKPQDVAPLERLLVSNRGIKERAENVQAFQTAIDSNVALLDKYTRALVQLDDIAATAKGFGATLDRDQLKEFVKEVAPERTEGPFYELTQINKGVEQNTADTVKKLDEMLVNQGDPDAIERQLSSIRDNLGAGIFNRDASKTVNALERVAGIRNKAEARGDQDAVIAANQTLDLLTKQLVQQVGYSKGIQMVNDNLVLYRKDFNKEEFQQRALSGVDRRVLLDTLKKYAPEETQPFYSLEADKPALAQTKAYKRFEELQKQQVSETVFSSKNLAAVAAASASIATLQKAGNRKVVSQLDEQIGVLDAQIKQGRFAGKKEPELQNLLTKRESLQLQREKKVDEAEFYGAIQAMGTTGVAATQMARAFGLTETQITALGVGAMGTYAAVKIASEVLGKEIPDSAKAFEKELVKAGKDVATGSKIPSNLGALRDTGKAMAKEVAEKTKEVFKGSEADLKKVKSTAPDQAKLAADFEKQFKDYEEQMKKFTSNKNPLFKSYADLQAKQNEERAAMLQSGKLQGSAEYEDLTKRQNAEIAALFKGQDRDLINTIKESYPKLDLGAYSEQIRASLGDELTKHGENVVKGIESSQGAEILGKVILSTLAVATSNYIASRTEDAVNLAELEKLAKEQSKALEKVLQERPEALDQTINELYNNQKKMEESIAEIQTVKVPTVQDTGKAKEEISKLVNEEIEATRKAVEALMEQQRKDRIAIFDSVTRQTRADEDIARVRTERERLDVGAIGRKYSLQNILNKALSGYAGDVEMPVDRQAMSTQQRVFADADNKLKGMIAGYADATKAMDAMRQRLEQLKAATRAEEDLMAASSDSDVIKAAKERHRELNEQMKKQIEVLDEASEKVRKFAESKYLLDQFSDSMYKLEDSLRDVSSQAATDAVRGMREFREAMDRMLGGSSPDALIPISTEDERMASRSGIQLRNLRSNRYDLLEAQLRDRLRTAEGEEAFKIRQQLTDIPEQRRRDFEVEEQRRQNSMLQNSLRPFEDYVGQLSRTLTTANLPEDRASEIRKLQEEVVSVMNRATQPISPETLMSELEANRPKLTKEQYQQEYERISALQEAVRRGEGADVYRGVPVWEKESLSGLQDSIKKSLSESPTFAGLEMEKFVADPIVSKLDETNKLLSTIAEEEFGIDELREKIIPTKKSSGGHISGPGGPKDDKIPAWLSNGEYVIKAASAKKLGYDFLEHLNSKGQAPKFATGGLVGNTFRNMSGTLSGFTDYLKEKRLSEVYRNKEDWSDSLMSLITQGGLASTELATRLANIPGGIAATGEGILDYITGSSVESVKKDVTGTYGILKDLVKERGLKGLAGDVASGLYGSAKESLVEGGLGFTTAALEAVAGAGAARAFKSSKLSKIAGPNLIPSVSKISHMGAVDDAAFAAEQTVRKKLSTEQVGIVKNKLKKYIDTKAKANPALGNINFLLPDEFDFSSTGKVDRDQILAVRSTIDMIDEYTKMIPGLTDDKLSTVVMNRSIGGIESPGLHASNVTARATAAYQNFEAPKRGGSLVMLDKDLFRNPKDFESIGYGPRRTVKHELGHHLMTEMEFLAHANRKKDLGLGNFVSQYEKIVNSLDEAIILKYKKDLPTDYAYTSPAEAFAEVFSLGDPKKSKYAYDLDEFIKTGRSAEIKSKLSAAKVSVNENRLTKVISDLRATARDEGLKEDDPWLVELMEEARTIKFAEGGRAGSYLERGKDKKDRYDKMLGFANGGMINELEYEKWAILSAQGADARLIEARRGRGPVDKNKMPDELKDLVAESYLGFGPLYDTDQYREALKSKKSFRESADKYASQLAMSRDPSVAAAMRSTTDPKSLAKLLLTAPMAESSQFIPSRNLIGTGPVLYQTIMDQTMFDDVKRTKPSEQFIGGEYSLRMAARDKVRRGLAESGRTEAYYDAIPDKIKELKRIQEYTAYIQGNVDLAKESGFNYNKKEFENYVNTTNDLLKQYSAGTDLNNLEFQQDVVDATRQYQYMSGVAAGMKRLEDKKLTGFGEESYLADPKAYLELRDKLRSGELTGERKEELETQIKKSTVLYRSEKEERDAFRAKIKELEEEEKSQESLMRYIREMFEKTASGKTSGPTLFQGSYGPKAKDIAAASMAGKNAFSPGASDNLFFNTLRDLGLLGMMYGGQSANVMHNGGVVNKTGKIFAEKGEVILSKNFAEGGLVGAAASQSLNQQITTSIDTSELESVLSNFINEVESVFSTELKVEDKQLKVEDKEFKVSVEQPDWKVPVEMPTDSLKVEVDLGNASENLKNAITAALSTPVKVDASSVKAVGGERLDAVAETIKSVQDRLITVKSDLENQIKMISTNNETTDIDSRVIRVVDTRLTNVNKDLSDLRNDVGRVQSDLRRQDQIFDSKLTELDYRLKNTMNITGIGKF